MIESLPFLLCVLVAVRFLPGARNRSRDGRQQPTFHEERWPLGWEILLAILVGGVLGTVGSVWAADGFLRQGALTANLHDVCSSVAAMRDDQMENYSLDRSFLVGWLPARLASRWGIADGLGLSASLSLGVLGSGLYLWARALHSRFAGLLTIVLTLAVAHLVTLGRTLNFYPQFVAVFVLHSGVCCLAVRDRSWKSLLLAGSTVSLVLLVDVRGLVWACCTFPILLWVAMSTSRDRWAGRLLVLGLPVLLSWFAAPLAYSPESTGLARQANPARYYQDHGPAGGPAIAVTPEDELPRFLWGHTPLGQVPSTVAYLVADTLRVAPRMRGNPRVVQGAVHILPFFPLAFSGAVFCLLGLWRYPARLGALVLTGLPFCVVLFHALSVEFLHRFAASGLPLVPVVLGIGLATLWHGRLREQAPDQPAAKIKRGLRLARPPARPILQLGALLMLVTGMVPSYLSPGASWRVELLDDLELHRMIHADRFRDLAKASPVGEIEGQRARVMVGCAQGLVRDADRGLNPLGQLYFGGPGLE